MDCKGREKVENSMFETNILGVTMSGYLVCSCRPTLYLYRNIVSPVQEFLRVKGRNCNPKARHMTFREYLDYFESIINKGADEQLAPYNDPMYYDYTKLNWARTNRWLKTGELTVEMIDTIMAIDEPQQWIIITEPWCGDAAHSVPFLHMAGELNDNITVSYELRDSEPLRINEYLTNGGKSIPKLIIRDKEGNDIATWGPRPADCQKVYDTLMAEKADFEKVKTELQIWYNLNKGKDIQEELVELLK